MGFHRLVNTRYFSEAAIDWKKNGGRYTTAPKGSRDYFQYWEEQTRRCMFGYKVADLWIPGRFYFYLNFFPMSRVPQQVMMRALEERRNNHGKLSVTTAEKIIEFPAFWEVQYEWQMFKHIAWYGGEFMGIQSPGGKHLCALKSRGAGWSYSEAADGVYNYNFIPGSKSYYFAGQQAFLDEDGILNKVQVGLDWVNQYSPYWKQNRQVKKSVMHQKASYLDSYGVEQGKMSEIIGQVVDKASKTRGKRGRKAVFEEGGSFPHLEKALRVSMGSMSEGSVYVGQISLFGTGGEQGPGIQGLENIFNSPDSWDMLRFPNVWESGMENSSCGYFVPCYRVNSWFMDENGNVDTEAAIAADDKSREDAASSGKPKDLDDRKAEYPRTPSEALQRLNGNGFNKDEIDNQIRRIDTDLAIQGMIRNGTIVSCDEEKSGVRFQVQKDAKPILDWPHKQSDDLTGCFSIIQRPYTDQNGNVPDNMYVISFDSYYKDESEDLTSLFSFKVWKQPNLIDPSYEDLPVAWFAGRRKNLTEVYDLMFKACKLYNAKAQGEISGGGQGVVTHAKTYRLLHWIKNEPEMIHNKELASKSAGNSYLMNMNGDRKKMAITYLEDWHMYPRGIDEKGNFIYNIRHVYDRAWLMEMKKFNPAAGNYDRISDALVAMFELKERKASIIKESKTKRKPLNKILFGGQNITKGITSSF